MWIAEGRCCSRKHHFLNVFKGDGEGLQCGELGQEVSPGFGPGSKAWKLWVACKRGCWEGDRPILKRRGVPASPEGGRGHRRDARAQGGWRAAAGALLPPTLPPPPGAASRREGAQAGGGGGGGRARGCGGGRDGGRRRDRAGGRGRGLGEGQPPGALRCRPPLLHHERRAAGAGRRRQREWGLRGEDWLEGLRPRGQEASAGARAGREGAACRTGCGSEGPQAGEPGRREGVLPADRRGPGQARGTGAGPWAKGPLCLTSVGAPDCLADGGVQTDHAAGGRRT